jgi:hypothetical protein
MCLLILRSLGRYTRLTSIETFGVNEPERRVSMEENPTF